MGYVGPVKRWEVYWADLDPAIGNEQAGESRPVLVVSNDEVNKFLGVVTIIPLTKEEGKQRKLYPFDIRLPKGCVGNDFTPIALPYQIRTISKLRLLRRAGELVDDFARGRVEDGLLIQLGIELDD